MHVNPVLDGEGEGYWHLILAFDQRFDCSGVAYRVPLRAPGDLFLGGFLVWGVHVISCGISFALGCSGTGSLSNTVDERATWTERSPLDGRFFSVLPGTSKNSAPSF